MDRIIVYPGASTQDTDVLNTNKNTMLGIGALAQAVFGTAASYFGLGISSPSGLNVTIAPGGIITAQPVDSTAYGSLPADTTDDIVKIGFNLTPTVLAALTAPTTAGQSINYLIEATFTESDQNPVALPYYNAANPSQPYLGPGGDGAAQNTLRADRVSIQVKAGAAANTGTQVTPAVDAGWLGLWVVTVNEGQTTLSSASWSEYSPAATAAGAALANLGAFPAAGGTITGNVTVDGNVAGTTYYVGAQGANFYLATTTNPTLNFSANYFIDADTTTGTMFFQAGSNGITLNSSGQLSIGQATSTGGFIATGEDSGGAQFRAQAANYGVILRNDNASAYLLQTASGAPSGTYNSFRPFSWNLATGAVSIDGTGVGASFGGTVSAANGTTGNEVVNYSQFGSSMAASGYQKLPSGLIMQWGNITGTAVNGETSANITYPLAFPNSNFAVFGTFQTPSNLIITVAMATGLTGSSVLIEQNSGSSQTYELFYFAVGY